MSLGQFLGVLSPLHIYLVTLLTGARRIGADGEGNVYYQARARRFYTHPRRWVLYQGPADPSRVPPEWHGWLHHQTDTPPNQSSLSFRRPWQKPPQANLTGTDGAYLPPGHILRGFKRDTATGDYQAWAPEGPAESRRVTLAGPATHTRPGGTATS